MVDSDNLPCEWDCYFSSLFQAVVWFYMHNMRPRQMVSSSLPQEQSPKVVVRTFTRLVLSYYRCGLSRSCFCYQTFSFQVQCLHSWTAPPFVMALRLVRSYMESTWAPHMASALADSIWKAYVCIFLQSQFDLMFCWVWFCHETAQPVFSWGWPAEQSARQGVASGSL